MVRGTLMGLTTLAILLAWGCSGPGKKPKKLNRSLIGAEMDFGRKAASYDLWQEAIFRWEKVATADPENSDAKNNLAVAYESIGDYDRAKALYQQAIELDEDSETVRKNYKRFLSFYKRHQRQLEREQQSRKEGEKDEKSQPPAPKPKEGNQ